MSSKAKERAEIHHRQEGPKQLSQNIRQKEQATRELTAKLRAECLARDAKTNTLKTVPSQRPIKRSGRAVGTRTVLLYCVIAVLLNTVLALGGFFGTKLNLVKNRPTR